MMHPEALREREAVAALLLHLADGYVDGNHIEQGLAQMLAGLGQLVLDGAHRSPRDRWLKPKLMRDMEDEDDEA